MDDTYKCIIANKSITETNYQYLRLSDYSELNSQRKDESFLK